MSSKTILLTLSICLFGSVYPDPQVSDKLAQIPRSDPQAAFSWRFYKESLDLSKNAAVSPFAIRMLFAALQNLASPFPRYVEAVYDQQMKRVLNIRDLNHMTGRYRKQLNEFERDSAIDIVSLLAAIGEGKLSGAVGHAAKNFKLSFGTFEKTGTNDDVVRSISRAMSNLTSGRAPDYLSMSDVDAAAQLLLMNQLNFNGRWRKHFREEWKDTCPFYLDSTRSTPVEFLFLEDYLPYSYDRTEDISAVELQFEKGSHFSCLLIKPIEGSLENLVSKLDHSLFRKIYNSLNHNSLRRKVAVRVPKFTISDKVKAKPTLTKMGLSLPFDDEVYRLYADNRRVPLADVIQGTSFTFGEEGEEEAAEILDRVMPHTFAAHQPFLFVIFERTTGVPIVIGHYVRPAASEVSSKAFNPLQCDNPPRGFKST